MVSSSEQVRDTGARVSAWVAGSAQPRTVSVIDLPAGGRPMWSRLREPAATVGGIAAALAPPA